MKEVVEGEIRLLIPEPVFYNPRMKLNRDICCAVVRGLGGKVKIKFLDLLAGTGAKGLRVAKAAGCWVSLNDANPKAWEVILKNAELNGLKVEAYNRKANLLLQEIEGLNFIDIDPFGTPIPFLDNAVMALKRGGYLGVTATDTAPLCGVHPKACLRKYGAVTLRTAFCHEVGMRILIGYMARTCAKYTKGARCLLSHYNEHYFRAYIHVSNGKKEADKALSEMGYLYYCKTCLNREYIKDFPQKRMCRCGERFGVSGPLWLGKLCDRGFLEKVFVEAWGLVDNPGLKTIRLLRGELEEPFYYDLHELCMAWKIEVPPTNKVLQVLRNLGFEASRTHYSPIGIKTNATVETFKKILMKN